MASLAEERDGGLLPFGWFGTVAYCTVLTLLFLFMGFPFNSVGERLLGTLAGATGTQISVADLSPYLSIAGPGFEASGVRVVGSDGTRFDFERLRVRPAWSLAWLRLTPALHVDVDGPLGHVVGTAVVDAATPAFDGELEGVDLARVPVTALWPDLTLSGTLDADVDLALAEGAAGPEGRVVFEARDGGINAGGLPMGLPYDTLTGEFDLGGESLLRIVSLKAVGPVLNADATGEIGMDEYFVRAPLDVEIQIQGEPNMVPAMRSMGLRVDSSGAATAHITGSPSEPKLR
jgi:type II secretion system protein N